MNSAAADWTIQRLLEWTVPYFARRGVDAPRLSAEMLLAHVLGVPRIQLYTDYHRRPDEAGLAAYRELVRRAGEHEPIAYLTGRAPFFNLDFEVGPGVLIPRPDTETLVENVLQMVRHQPDWTSPRVLDLCTGSGCIAAAIAANLKTASVVAIDKSPQACEFARRNIERLGLAERVTVAQGDLFEPLAKMVDVQPYDLITANPPYIAHEQMSGLPRNVRDYEPPEALDGGPDGLDLHRRILAEAPRRLRGGGRIYLEIAFDQGEAARELLAGSIHFDEVKILRDYGGRDRVLAARRTE